MIFTAAQATFQSPVLFSVRKPYCFPLNKAEMS